MMLYDWIDKWASYAPNKFFCQTYPQKESLTYQELNDLGKGLAIYLQREYNVTAGDRVAILAENNLGHLVLLAAAFKAGFIIVPLNYRLTEHELVSQLEVTCPKCIFIQEHFKTKLSANTFALSQLSYEDINSLASLPAVETRFPPFVALPESPLMILFTSGSTGLPKGVIYTYQMMFWNSLNTALRLNLSADDLTINVMPFFHTGGWNVFVLPFLHFGGAFISFQKFEPEAVLDCLTREKCTIFMAVPTMLQMMVNVPHFQSMTFPHLRYIICGGEACPIPLIETWATKNIPIRQGYGMTEAGPNLTSLHQDDALRKKGSIGTPNFYVQANLLADNNTIINGPGVGELLIGGPVVTPGYWNNPEETEKAFFQNQLKTGDIIKRDEEGYLFVIDRKKNMYISGGENVYPAEVERVIYSLESVQEVAVIGVADAKWGEVGKAFIVKKNPEVTHETIIDHCKKYLAGYKIPKHFAFLVTLPKNDAGKIDRKGLKNLNT